MLELLAKRPASAIYPRQLAEEALGPVASADSLTAIRRAASRREALALMLTSPEFQRK